MLSQDVQMLVTRVGGIACALPIAHVVETMRPLPVEPVVDLAPALSFVCGLAVIRGSAVPVIDAARLLGHTTNDGARFVIVRTGADAKRNRIALLVDAVIAVKPLEPATLAQLPPLLRSASRDIVAAIGTLDDGLLLVLDAGRVVPDDAWVALGLGMA